MLECCVLEMRRASVLEFPNGMIRLRSSTGFCPVALFVLSMVLLLTAGCDAFSPAPTLAAPVELTTPTPPPTRRPSPTPRRIYTPTPRPTATITPTASATVNPLLTSPTPDAPPEETLAPEVLTQIALAETATLSPAQTLVGRSVEGRRLVVHRLGNGPHTLLLVGGIHGGWEGNTVRLMEQLIDHFAANPDAIAPGVSLAILPVLNPDGLLKGRSAEGRFNASGVDLNRNWSCGWEPEAFWQDQRVDPGPMPFSEPETAALADYILLNPPTAVLFYHSAANGVFAGSCEGDHGSQTLGHIYGRAATYPSDGRFTGYVVTGDASNWVDGQGIPALTIELQSWTDPEFERNLAGIMAVQCDLTRKDSNPQARAWVAANCVEAES
ncbi:MAG: hypothetical protein Kow0077_11790 [Anaerolineae bacterium]